MQVPPNILSKGSWFSESEAEEEVDLVAADLQLHWDDVPGSYESPPAKRMRALPSRKYARHVLQRYLRAGDFSQYVS